MTTINASNSPDESLDSKKNWTEQKNINTLLYDSVVAKFGQLSMSGNSFESPVDPTEYDRYISNPSGYINGIKNEMKLIRNTDNKNSYNVLDADINSLTSWRIRNVVLSHTARFVSYRNRVLTRAKQLQPELKTDNNAFIDFSSYIKTLSQDILYSYIQSPKKLTNLIHEQCKSITTTKQNWFFDIIFHDIETIWCSKSEFAILKRITIDFEKWFSPKESDIEMILRLYKSSSDDRKKTLLNDLGASFSIAFAQRQNWIQDNEIDDFLEKIFPELTINVLPENEKAEIRAIAMKDSDINLTIDDIVKDKALQYIFDSKNRKNIAKNIAKEWSWGPNIDETTEDKKYTGFTKKITDRFNSEVVDKWIINYSYHDAFLYEITLALKTTEGKNKIDGIEKFSDWAVVKYTWPDGNPRYLKVLQTIGTDWLPLDVHNWAAVGIKIADITGVNGSIGAPKSMEFSYDEIMMIFQKGMNDWIVYSQSEFDAQLVTDPTQAVEWKILDATEADEHISVSASNILLKINELDPEGSFYGFDESTYFIADAEEQGKDGQSKKMSSIVWRVSKIHADTNLIDLVYQNGNIDTGIRLQDFFDTIKTQSFKRINSISNDGTFVSKLKSNPDFWLFENTELHDGHLTFTEKDEKMKEHKYTIHNFVGSWDEHIRMGSIEGGIVSFGEYDGEDIAAAKKYVKEKGENKAEGFYTWKSMTYGAFIKYLSDNKLKASKEDKIVEHAHHDDHHHEHGPHMHGSFMTKLFNAHNFHDLFKAGELIIHSIEHALEKWSKANAAHAALRMGKFLNLPASIQAQITADVVDGNKELIEKYTKKLQNLNGPIGRAKAIHVTHNSDARPEEVVAAIYHMIQWYGQLYAEDPEMLNQKWHSGQWSNAFLYALINACGFTGADLEDMKIRAYKKWSEEMNPDACTEEGAIYGFMKIIDGKAEEYPIAAALIKASGGPGGFEKAWRTEWAENARQKWERQAGAVPNQDSRLTKVIGYMKTWEYNSAVGWLKKMMWKTPSTKYRAGDFVFLVGGFTKMLSNEARQKIFNENQWSSFHGCAFVRHDSLADTYIATVRLALADMWEGYLSRFESIMQLAPYWKQSTGDKLSFAELMSVFWQETFDKWLHDRLQWHNNWLMETAKNNETVRKYIEQLDGIHDQTLSGNTPSLDGGSDNSVYAQFWYAESNIFKYDKKTGTRSIHQMLKKLKFHGGGIDSMKKMDDDVVGRVWKPILDTLKKTRDDPNGTEEQKKQQFLKTRSELISFFSEEFSTTTKDWTTDKIDRQIKSQPYFEDLQKIGIDPHGLFPDIYRGIDFETQDSEAWKVWNASWIVKPQSPDVHSELNRILSSSNDAQFRQRA